MGIIQTLKQSSFLKHNMIFFVGALVVSVLNYIYYPVLGRMLSLSEYGEVQVAVSLFTQLIILMTVLGQVTVNVVANYESQSQRNKVIFDLQKLTFMLCIGILIVGSAGSWWIANALQFTSPIPFIILLFALLATVPLTFQTAYLRGEKKFATVSIANIIGSAGKLVCSVALVAIGFGTAGAVGGIVAAQMLAFFYAARYARKLGFTRPADEKLFKLPELKNVVPELKFSAFVFVASLGVTILSSIDTIVVKAFFDPETAGGYAGISTVAKIIFFLTASIAQVMLPSIKLKAPKVENRRFLIKSFVMLSVIGGGAALVFALLPNLVVGILMGEAFTPYAHILPMLSLALFFVSLINLIVCYYIALRRYQIAVVVVTGVIFTTLLLFIQHSTLEIVARNLMLGSAAMLGMFMIWRVFYEFMTRRQT